MANRYLNQFQLTYEKDTVTIFGNITIGASGAVSAFQGGGISNVTHSDVGEYTITLSNSFKRFLGFQASMLAATASSTASVALKMNPANVQTDICVSKTVIIQALNFAGAGANPTSGEMITFRLVLRNSSVGPYDG